MVSINSSLIKHHKNGMTVREIGVAVQKSYFTVYDIIKRYKTLNSVENKSKQGRPKRSKN